MKRIAFWILFWILFSPIFYAQKSANFTTNNSEWAIEGFGKPESVFASP